jgi:hypothetical protein
VETKCKVYDNSKQPLLDNRLDLPSRTNASHGYFSGAHLQPAEVQRGVDADHLEHLVLHGLRAVGVVVLLLALPQVHPPHEARDVQQQQPLHTLGNRSRDGSSPISSAIIPYLTPQRADTSGLEDTASFERSFPYRWRLMSLERPF